MEKIFEIKLPKLGESLVTATIVQILKKEGENIKKDEPFLIVSTDKLNSEIPSPVSGKILKIFVKEGEEIEVGTLLAKVDVQEKEESFPVESKKFFSPAVKTLAKEKSMTEAELNKIPATGKENRVTKKDVESFSKDSSESIEKIPLTVVRKQIAEKMCEAMQKIPHATLYTEVNVTTLLALIDKKRAETHQKLSITSFLAYAICKALEAFPHLNSSLENDTLLVKKDIHLGFAVNLQNGLVVPVIRQCQKLSVLEIASQITSLVAKAKASKLTIDDVSKGTFTLTNFGMSKILMGFPIIRYPEAAILGAGAIHKSVKVVENDQMAICSIMGLTLSFDHRIVDGMYACDFLYRIQEILENPDLMIRL